MKRILCLVLALLLTVLLFSGCSAKVEADSKLSVVCTVFPQYDFIRSLAGDLVDVKMLVPLGTESHDFLLENLTVADLKTVATSNLFIYVGGESDADWVGELRDTVNDKGTTWLKLTDTVETLQEVESQSMTEGHGHDHSRDGHTHHDYGAYDEHVWTSPKRAKTIVAKLCEVLCELDPENAEVFKTNRDAYLKELDILDQKLTAAVDGKECKMIFGDRFPFRYLCADYSIVFDAAFQGCSSGVDPSVAQMTSLTKSAVESKAKSIFYMENSDPLFATSIAEAVGGKAVLLHSCHTFTKYELDGGATYLSTMSDNIEKITEAFR
ncbi:MAG: zinc ABC transporter substrate-binding protein [Clostridia bacterium]|nr:zinc ABC transporter substrate-binding protein [Clostridia bacterium]